jgi:hypothetical protein
VTRLNFSSRAKTLAGRRSALRDFVSVAAILIAALLVVASANPALSQGSANPLGDIHDATAHIGYLKQMLMHLHWRWIEANKMAVGADQASAAALEAAGKCSSGAGAAQQAQSLINAAGAKLAAAGAATARTKSIEVAILDDVNATMKTLAARDAQAVNYASYSELQETQDSFPWAAMASRTGLDPSNDPITGQGLLSAAWRNLRDARQALAKCGGHAAATGSTPERFASRSER